MGETRKTADFKCDSLTVVTVHTHTYTLTHTHTQTHTQSTHSLFTQLVEHAPVLAGGAVPLTLAWSNIDIN